MRSLISEFIFFASLTSKRYNKICGNIRQLAYKLTQLPPNDLVRLKHEELLLEKLYAMGIIATKTKVSDLENKITVSALCRRRIGVVMCRLKMSETISGVSKPLFFNWTFINQYRPLNLLNKVISE